MSQNIQKKKINKNIKISKNLKICVIGLTYKYGVSDTRNSQNLEIYNELKKEYTHVNAYDPFLNDKKFRNLKNESF